MYVFFKETFDTIVVDVLKRNQPIISNGTCYVHLTCMRDNLFWCLDWREICDNKVDCWPDPVDEQYCYKLEQTECSVNEYRCRNGQCVPKVFLLDNGFCPDCLDTTDEDLRGKEFYPSACNQGDPSFRCADAACYHWNDMCWQQYCGGAGSCRPFHLQQFQKAILSRSSNYHLTDECWATMICLIEQFSSISSVSSQYYLSIYAFIQLTNTNVS